MPVTVDGLQLYTGQESTNAVAGSPDVTQPPGQTPADALLVALEAVESASVGGRATGLRISRQSGYSSDPNTALAEWLQEFESLVHPEQGTGYDIVDDERDRTITATVTSVSWTFAYGEPFDARWTLDATRGEGVMPSSSRSPSSDTPTNSPTIAGEDLDTVTEKRTELRMAVDETPIALTGTADTVITPREGVVRTTTLAGRRSDTTANLRSFDDTLRGKVGGNQEVTYQTGMPGSSYTGVIGNYDSTYNAGTPALIDYALTFTQGNII